MFRGINGIITSRIVGFMIVLGVVYGAMPASALSKTSLLLLQKTEEQIQVELANQDYHEICKDLKPGQLMNYQFHSSQKLAFNIHYHQGTQTVTPVHHPKIAFQEKVFYPDSEQTFCLMWFNPHATRVNIAIQYRIGFGTPPTEDGSLEVFLKLDEQKQNIRIVGTSNQSLATIHVGEPIHNFVLNRTQDRLVVLTSSRSNSVLIYDVPTQKLIHSFAQKEIPRFAAFSADDRWVAIANEHSSRLAVLAIGEGTAIRELSLPVLPLALDASDDPKFLMVRSEKEVLQVTWNPLKISERQAKLPLLFGDQTLYVDPTEMCFAHGVPHPLFTPKHDSMSEQGLPGKFPTSALLMASKPSEGAR